MLEGAVPSEGKQRDWSSQYPLQAVKVPFEPEAVFEYQKMLSVICHRDRGTQPPLIANIFNALANDIVSGKLAPCETLNSVELAYRFNTSRTPVREALVELEHQGVVVMPPRRRPYIAPLTKKTVKEIYDIRACLSGLVSELIVDLCSDEEIAELWRWQEQLNLDIDNSDFDAYFWHNVGFRLAELHLTRSEQLERMFRSLGLRTLQLRHLSLSFAGRAVRSLEGHRRLLEAYGNRDRSQAIAETRNLIRAGYDAIMSSGVIAD